MEILPKLFGPHRIKLLRTFLNNPEEAFEANELSQKLKVPVEAVRKELNVFKGIRLVKPKTVVFSDGKKETKANGWQLNQNFKLAEELRTLLGAEVYPDRLEIARKFGKCGRIKLLVAAGVFADYPQGEIDLVLVGDNLKKQIIEQVVRSMEIDVGKELNYAVLDTDNFLYRLHSSDRFVRDLFDHPHQRLIDKISS